MNGNSDQFNIDQAKSRLTTLLVVVTVTICIFTMLGVVAIILFVPKDSNTVFYIASVLGVSVPITGTFIALIQQQQHLAVNSRMTQLLEISKQASEAIGQLKERERAETHPAPQPKEGVKS